MSIKINGHHIYQDSRFITEKTILENLVKICGFSTEVGVIDFFPDTPTIQIGFVEKEEEGKMPMFKKGSRIEIHLVSASDSHMPFEFPKNLSYEALYKIVIPLALNWIEVATFLGKYYESNKDHNKSFLELSLKRLKIWKEEIKLLNKEQQPDEFDKRLRTFFTFFTKIKEEERWFQTITVEEKFRWGYSWWTLYLCRHDRWQKMRFIN